MTQGLSTARRALDVGLRFLVLGCLSFGGPAAHLGYFRRTFVQRLGWLDDDGYARLVALAQFLPGPASSQVGFAIGLQRAGLFGGLAAFIGFTLPSFLLMTVIAVGSRSWMDQAWLPGVIDGLKLLALVVVADAVMGLYQSFCRRTLTQSMALITAAAVLVSPWIWIQPLLLLVMGLVGARRLSVDTAQSATVSGRLKRWPLITFVVIVAGLLVVRSDFTDLALPFFSTGSLVFGGGHVVLPLLQAGVGASMPADQFLFGYASAQAMPGPLFTIAAYLGALLQPDQPWWGAVVATLAVFLPGFLLVLALSQVWQRLAQLPRLAGALAGVNAAVVGLLLAALYQPVFVTAIDGSSDLALALLGLLALRLLRCPVLVLVAVALVIGGMGWA
ncbi:chorismate-binding protein [Saccharospirillum sp. MSK14-1]|uniref:chromate efflux transporter n=1 Tax=Saccharospirillum sp. MSK14-1 TaxID=1897632 RepID=UPI000D357CE1|nr:chromate efflux transporter [Saccharospirillum sp. MSK14-1]PTY37543.1 chorismate-binding protein [Saccharospirillum sp. MSK14-1]